MKEKQKIPLAFYRTAAAGEPVREWLKGLDAADRHCVGLDLMRVQLFCLHQDQLVALHGFIKKTRAIPDEDLKLARQRKKEIER